MVQGYKDSKKKKKRDEDSDNEESSEDSEAERKAKKKAKKNKKRKKKSDSDEEEEEEEQSQKKSEDMLDILGIDSTGSSNPTSSAAPSSGFLFDAPTSSGMGLPKPPQKAQSDILGFDNQTSTPNTGADLFSMMSNTATPASIPQNPLQMQPQTNDLSKYNIH